MKHYVYRAPGSSTKENILRIISLYLAKNEHVVFMLVSAESCL